MSAVMTYWNMILFCYQVASRVCELSAGSGAKLTTSVPGQAAFIVLESADMDSAAEEIVEAVWVKESQVKTIFWRFFYP